MSEMSTDNDVRRQAERMPDLLLDAVMDLVFGENDESGPNHHFSITLTVNGQAISGLAVSPKTWTEGVAKDISGTGAPGEKLAELVTGVMGEYAKVAKRLVAEANEKDVLPPGHEFLHLAEVTAGDLAGVKWLRVRMDAIDAWSFGRMLPSV